MDCPDTPGKPHTFAWFAAANAIGFVGYCASCGATASEAATKRFATIRNGAPDVEPDDPVEDPDYADALTKLADAEARHNRSYVQWRIAWKWEQHVRLAYERRLLAMGVDPAELRADQYDAHQSARTTSAVANSTPTNEG